MRKSFLKIAFGLFCFGLMSQVALVQGQTTASVFGTVSDATGGVLPGASVSVTNVDTGVARTALTDDEGNYLAVNLALGSYEVSGELTGFQVAVRTGITLTMGREAEVNLTLNVGEITERVTVTGEAPLVETTKSDLSDLLDTRQIEDLPLDGRSYTQLAVMQAGVMSLSNRTGSSFSGTGGAGVRISIQGGRSMNTGFSLDGTNIKDALGRTPGSAAGQNLGVDTIREFSVKSTAYSAEFGGSGGGMISVVTKSGTNDLHGNMFWYHRNSALDARNFRDSGELPPFKRNQFGFTVGGPIVQGRTFFFGSYEGLREDLSLTDIFNVPTQEVKDGFLPGVGPVDIHPDVRKWLDAYPLPNGRIFDDGRGEFSTTRSRVFSQDYFMVKIDHQIGDSDSFFVRYTLDDASRFEPLPFPGYDREGVTRYQYVTIEETKILSAALLNTARFAFNRSRPSLDSVAEGFGEEFTLIPLPDRIGSRLVVPGLVQFGADPFLPRSTLLNTFQVSEKLTYTRGSHSINVGMDYHRYQMNGFSASRRHGRLRFRSYEGFLTGTNVRDWQYLVPGTGEMKGWRQSEFGLYLQDDMKLGPNFTLNMGVRWEFVTSPTEVGGRVANVRHYLDPAPTVGDPFFNPPKANFGPRVGLAWDPFGTGKTAIRSGFGVFHQQLTSGTWTLPAVQNEPFFLRLSVARAPFPDLVITSTGDLPPGTPTPFEFNPSSPYMMNWNTTLQHQLPGEIVFSGSYVGSRGVHLGSHVNFNIREHTTLPDGRKKWVKGAPRLNPAFSSVSFKHFNMDSIYHAFQMRLSKRFAGGLQFQSSYTFGKNIDNVSESQGAGLLDPFEPGRQRSLSDLQTQHSWNLNYSYDLPQPEQGGVLGVILGGWKMSGIVSLSSGNPTSVETSFNRDRSGASVTGGGGPETPNLRPGGDPNPVIGDGRDPDNYLSGSPFILQEDGTYGNLGRNTVIGPGIATFDLSFVKVFQVDESRSVQFRSEFFNIFNRPNYGTPSMNVFTNAKQCPSTDSCNPSSSFGRINSTSTSPRQIQLALKFIF
jgi:outer membrane receptor protein involved in Fe transport